MTRLVLSRIVVVLICLCCACVNAPEPAPPTSDSLGDSHTIPGWLFERPFVQARGDWEPFMFVIRRGHPSSFLRDLEQRRGFAEPSPRDNWAAVFNQDSIDYEVRAGSNYWTTQLFKGFGLDAEAEDREHVKGLVERLHQAGFTVGGYVGGTIAYETFLSEEPSARDWFAPLEYWGEAATYNSQYFRRRIWFDHPGYKDYLKKVLRLGVVDYEMDLIHFDNISNVGKTPVFSHPMAAEAFREYLRTKYTPERLKERIGFGDTTHIEPPIAPALGNQEFFIDPLVMEWIDFRCHTLAAYIKELTDYVRSLSPRVATDINIGTRKGDNAAWNSSQDISLLLPNTDIFIVEGKNGGSYTEDNRLISNIRDYKIGRTFSNLVLNRMGSPGGSEYTPVTVPEQLAFNQHCLGPASMNPDNWKYIKFLNENFHHYSGTANVADVAILRSYPSMAYNNYTTHQSTILFEQTLIQHNIPFDIIFDKHLDDLSKYSVLVLANQESLSSKALDQINRYVRAGGGLVATGLSSLFDDWRRRRPTFGLNDLFQVDPPPPAARGELPEAVERIEKRNYVGEGRVVYITAVEPSMSRPRFADMTNDYWKLPANSEELRSAVEWAAAGELSLEVEAPPYVVAELLEQREKNKLLLHLVNFNVVRNTTVRDIGVKLRTPSSFSPQKITLMTAEEGASLNVPFRIAEARAQFTIPELGAYALVVIE